MEEKIEERRKDVYLIEIEALRAEVNALRVEVGTLSHIDSELIALRKLYDAHDILLVRGNGKPSLQEDVRSLLKLAGSLRFWMTAIALTFIGQFGAISIAMILYVIRLMP